MAEEEKDFGKKPQSEFKRWRLEIKTALRREKSWRDKAEKVWKIYKGEIKEPFNILWSNIETLRPSLYNSTPRPDVRRRFKDVDPLGKAVSEVLERGATYSIDCGNFDERIKMSALDALVCGRAVDDARYIPTITEKEKTQGEEYSTQEQAENNAEVSYEKAEVNHIKWDEFTFGEGDNWQQVMWVAFKYKLKKADAREKFGDEIVDKIEFNLPTEGNLNHKANEDIQPIFMLSEFWEVWDKEHKKVFFINFGYNKGIIYPKENPSGEPPVNFKEFFPIPEPLRLVEDSTSTLPIIPYSLYEKQAEELNRLTTRIDNIAKILRVRLAYDKSLPELAKLIEAGENDAIPLANASAWIDRQGLDKAIWFMPTDILAKTLQELYVARDNCKQIIYEITGISDIIRGATNPNETLGAQQIKNQWGTLRLQRMQREVQRYVRDLIRLICEVIAEKFSYQTMAKMTGLKFPTNLEKQQAQFQYQQQSMMAQQSGQQPPEPPPILKEPSWEEIDAVLKNDPDREFRIDIETDSTVASTLSEDMQSLQEVMLALQNLVTGMAEPVQMGFISKDVVKALALVVCRRSKMGLEVEDIIEKGVNEPQQQGDPNAAKAQADLQAKQQQMQQDMQLEQQRMQAEQANRQAELQAQMQIEQAKASASIEIERQKSEIEAQLQRERMQGEFALEQAKLEFERWKVELEVSAKIEQANISAEASKENAATQAATKEIASEVTQ